MALSKIRKYDEQFEKCVGEFLDRYFYPKFKDKYDGKFQRNSDVELQCKGIDVIATKKNGVISNLDEKAAAHYVNSDLRTFAFEVSFRNRAGLRQKGWLLNQDSKTDTYVLCWVYANTEKFPYRSQEMQSSGYTKAVTTDYFKSLTTEDITGMDVVVLKKEKVRENIRLTDEEIRQVSKNLLGNPQIVNGFTFFKSEFLAEQPVNVIIEKSRLAGIGSAFYVTRTDMIDGFRQ